MNINSYWLKLTGKVNIEKELHLDHGYKIKIEGAVPSSTDVSNEDGSFDRIFKLVPILVEIEDEKGEVIKAKDTRSWSAKLRRTLYHVWESENDESITHEEHYERFMKFLFKKVYDLAEEAKTYGN